MKTDKNFRLSKTAKCMLAIMPFKSTQDRNEYKRMLIAAESDAIRTKNARYKDKENES